MIRLAVALWLVAIPAAAQNCAGVADVYAILAQFGETRIWIGATDADGTMAEIWGNATTGTWSIIASNGARACLILQGSGYSAAVLGAPV